MHRFPIRWVGPGQNGQPIGIVLLPIESGRRSAATAIAVHRVLSQPKTGFFRLPHIDTVSKQEVQTMKRILPLLVLISFGVMCRADQSKSDVTNRLQQAGNVLRQVMDTPDKGIPEEVMEHAKCVAVVPHLVKGGFVFGAEGGRGVATCRTAHGWSAPAFFDVEGGSWGLQIGVEGIDLVMIIQNDHGMQQLLGSKFQIGQSAGWRERPASPPHSLAPLRRRPPDADCFPEHPHASVPCLEPESAEPPMDGMLRRSPTRLHLSCSASLESPSPLSGKSGASAD